MSEIFHIWNYIKEFTIFNVKQNKYTLPSELVHYIYSYAITDELKKKINSNYISNSINRQLDNNKFWRLGIEDVFKFLNIREEITIDMKNIPYPNITTFELFFWDIKDLVEYKKYSYLKCNKDGKYWGESYQNREMDGTNDTENTLILNLYSNE